MGHGLGTHTKGPWAIWTSNSYRRIGSESTGREVAYAVMQSDGWLDIRFPNGGEDGPDARLIAAAPELLEACRAARAFIRELETKHDDFTAPLLTLDAAIAKATKPEGE